MSHVNPKAKEIHCKIVYYGPSLGGKTTNIQWIYQKHAQDQKTKLVAVDSEVERTFFFDFLPMNVGQVHGFNVRFHLYSVPGQVIYDASRRLVLKGVDGIVFVADSQVERMEENIEALKNLEKNLEQQGYDIREIPLIMQYNKRDLPNAASLAELRMALNRYNAPEIEGCASEGKGVDEALKIVSKSILNMLKGGANL
jgi:hypothetical protein